MITSALIGLAIGLFGDDAATIIRRYWDSKWAELAAFVAIGIIVSAITNVIGVLL